jgi:NAD(P)-dependent dehydrogenase (short-subunit alcohol dehydrogenase family)
MSQLESAMTNYSNFAGRTALVTGGASGLGRAMAEALAATGASLVLFDLNHAQARHLASDLKAKHSIRAEAVEGSVTNSDDVARGCRTAIELTGRLDIVMNNAGIIGNAPSIELEEATWRRVIDVNLTGVFLVAQAAARIMIPVRAFPRSSTAWSCSWTSRDKHRAPGSRRCRRQCRISYDMDETSFQI